MAAQGGCRCQEACSDPVQSQSCGQDKAKEDGCPQGTPRVVLCSCPRAAPHLPSLQLSVLKAAGGTGTGTSMPRSMLSASSTSAPRGCREGRSLPWQKMLQGGTGGTVGCCQRVWSREKAPASAAISLGTIVSTPGSCSTGAQATLSQVKPILQRPPPGTGLLPASSGRCRGLPPAGCPAAAPRCSGPAGTASPASPAH